MISLSPARAPRGDTRGDHIPNHVVKWNTYLFLVTKLSARTHTEHERHLTHKNQNATKSKRSVMTPHRLLLRRACVAQVHLSAGQLPTLQLFVHHLLRFWSFSRLRHPSIPMVA